MNAKLLKLSFLGPKNWDMRAEVSQQEAEQIMGVIAERLGVQAPKLAWHPNPWLGMGAAGYYNDNTLFIRRGYVYVLVHEFAHYLHSRQEPSAYKSEGHKRRDIHGVGFSSCLLKTTQALGITDIYPWELEYKKTQKILKSSSTYKLKNKPTSSTLYMKNFDSKLLKTAIGEVLPFESATLMSANLGAARILPENTKVFVSYGYTNENTESHPIRKWGKILRAGTLYENGNLITLYEVELLQSKEICYCFPEELAINKATRNKVLRLYQ